MGLLVEGRSLREEADQEVGTICTTLPPFFSEPTASTWILVRDVLKARGGRDHFPCPLPGHTPPFSPHVDSILRLTCPLTSKQGLHRKHQQDSRGWERKALFWIFLLLLPALCQHCALHNSGATQVCFMAHPRLQ